MPATLTPPNNTLTPVIKPAATSTANYFITLCTHERQCLFGEIIDGEMQLNKLGNIVEDEWESAARDRPDLNCDQWIIMPNHIHGIISLAGPSETEGLSGPDISESIEPVSGSESTQQHTLSAWIEEFKSAVTDRINSHRQNSRPIWQAIDDQQLIPHHFAFNIFRQYIRSNPHAWLWDKLHPDSPSDWLHSEGAI